MAVKVRQEDPPTLTGDALIRWAGFRISRRPPDKPALWCKHWLGKEYPQEMARRMAYRQWKWYLQGRESQEK